MDLDLKTWGPMTILTVIVVLFVLVGGLIEVVTARMTFEQFLDDILKFVAGALALGAGIGRGIRLGGTAVTTRRR